MSTLGLVIMLQVQQQLVRSEVKQKLKLDVDEEELFTFIIPNDLQQAKSSGFIWVRPKKEFRYKGGMYDVIRKKQHAETTEYMCISDTKEAEIFTQLDDLVAQGVSTNPKQKQQRTCCYQVLKSLYFQIIEGVNFKSVDVVQIHLSKYLPLNSNPHLRLLLAPPKSIA